jgi:hypothetical protein
MAFPKAAGYGNLPNGNFSPVIYSRKVQKAFRNSSVVEDVTNTDYSGEISNFGDSVRIIKEPDITINTYARGTKNNTQALQDADFTMTVDQANYFQFAMDDIEEAHSHVNFMDLATDRAGFKLRDKFDSEVLGYMSGWEKDGSGDFIRRTAPNGTKSDSSAGADELLAAHSLDITDFGGSDLGVAAEVTSIPLAANGGSGAITSPLSVLNRFGRMLDQANVDTEGRWVVVDPIFIELLMDGDSKLVDSDFGGDGEIRNGMLPKTIRGFRVYKSNNLPFVGTGAGTTASAGSEDNFGVLVCGHNSAVSTAQQIAKTETFRSPDTFADITRGMQLYGRKILRSEGLLTGIYNVA